MTAKTTPGQAVAKTGRPAGPEPAGQAQQPSSVDRMVRYGIWLAILVRGLGDRRFQTSVITRVLGAYALASVIRGNEARPVRRAASWYMKLGDPRDIKRLQRAQQALRQGER